MNEHSTENCSQIDRIDRVIADVDGVGIRVNENTKEIIRNNVIIENIMKNFDEFKKTMENNHEEILKKIDFVCKEINLQKDELLDKNALIEDRVTKNEKQISDIQNYVKGIWKATCVFGGIISAIISIIIFIISKFL